MYADDNTDNLPRDGMGQNGHYPGNSGAHADPNAWFNGVPPLLHELTLNQYWNAGLGAPCERLPFPGAKGRVWHCPTARMSPAELPSVAGDGKEGFFSYEMNIDLKKRTPDENWDYPCMPLMPGFANPAATVLLFDCAFNPKTEVVNGSPAYNSVNPANRWRNLASRHRAGAMLNFLDGHAAYFTDYYLTNGAGDSEALNGDVIWNSPYRARHP